MPGKKFTKQKYQTANSGLKRKGLMLTIKIEALGHPWIPLTNDYYCLSVPA